MDINSTLTFIREFQNGMTLIFTTFLQALFLKTANIRIIITIIMSGTFVIIYIDPFVFEYFNIEHGSKLESLIYGVSTLIGAEIVQIILVTIPKASRKRVEELIGVADLSKKD